MHIYIKTNIGKEAQGNTKIFCLKVKSVKVIATESDTPVHLQKDGCFTDH